MLLHFLSECFLNLLSADIISILLEYVAFFRGEIPAFRHAKLLLCEVSTSTTLLGLSVKYSVGQGKYKLRRCRSSLKPEAIKQPFELALRFGIHIFKKT
jgi:hypothetical protein